MLAKAIVAACVTLTAGGAEAITLRWSADLDQAQETVVTVAAPGAFGAGSGKIDTETGDLSWKVTYGDLTGDALNMHFHGPAPVGVNAGVAVDIGAVGGLASGTMGAAMITSAQVAELLGGLWYINVHTAANPGGEIRGQVHAAPVPLPAALPLAIAGMAVFGGLSMRRRLRRGSRA